MNVRDSSAEETALPETATIDVFDVAPNGSGAEAFLVVHLDGTPRVILLPDGVEVTIGRSRASTIFADDERVSRMHARVVRRGADVFAIDLGSRNGTRVAGQRIEGERRLRGGDVIEVGPVRAVVAVAASMSPAVAPAEGVAVAPSAAVPAASDVRVVADARMLEVYERCRRVAGMPLAVLITGETGVGKERIAELIQSSSPRADKPFVRLHVGALPEALIEGELFGHERGAFTGADRRHRGYFEAASGGTLMLDEIGELALPLQAKLLRVLESGRVSRLGSTDELDVDVRILAATNKDLAEESKAGRFRPDLFFRLSAFRIDVPPLRERPSEIPLLASLFARDMARVAGRSAAGITPAALTALGRYAWPGNIRELKHVIEAAMVMAGGEIDVQYLPAAIRDAAGRSPEKVAPPEGASQALGDSVDAVEREAIIAALNACGGNQTRAAERLAVSRRTLIYKMKRLGIRSARVVES